MSFHLCPECLSELTDGLGHLWCGDCQKQYQVVDGLPVFSKDPTFYFGEIPREAMKALLTRASLVGWRVALLEHADVSGAMDFHGYVAPEQRAGFKFLLDRFETGTVLDYGCGLGTITTNLARSFGKIYATDLTLERVKFTQLRAQQENLDNVVTFCSGDTTHIPLRSESVDAIILNGVLEWVPDYRSGDPRSVQIEFLRELRRILSKDGFLFIGIENRIGYGYLLGKKEEHARLRYVSLLPRKIANLYSRAMRGKPYRNYTYSQLGYRSVLKLAGFPEADFWGFIPDYRDPQKVIRLSQNRMIRESIGGLTVRKRLRNILIRPLFPWISESFGVLAGNAPVTPYITRLAGHISDTYLDGKKLEIFQYSVTNTGMVHVCASSGKVGHLIKLPLSARTEHRMEAGLRNTERIAASVGPCFDSYLIPRPIASGKFLGQAFLVEPLMAGLSLDKLTTTIDVRVFFPKLREFLVVLCKNTRRPGASWPEILSQHARKYGLPLIEAYRRRGLSERLFERWILEIVDYLAAETPLAEGFHCAIHGDFWHGNVLAAAEGTRITGILDWDRFEPQSLPFLDLLHLIAKYDEILQHIPWEESVVGLHKAVDTESNDAEEVRDYATEIGVDKDLISRFVIVYWMRQCLLLLRDDVPQLNSFLHKEVDEPLNYFHNFIQCD